MMNKLERQSPALEGSLLSFSGSPILLPCEARLPSLSVLPPPPSSTPSSTPSLAAPDRDDDFAPL
jgi:hypothetical protein